MPKTKPCAVPRDRVNQRRRIRWTMPDGSCQEQEVFVVPADRAALLPPPDRTSHRVDLGGLIVCLARPLT